MRFFVFVFTLLIKCCIVYSQDEVQLAPQIVPPSPTAGELGRYGLIQVGLSTGSVATEIPLYNFKTKNLELPISLSYSSNGVRVDEIASWVGMQWSLNAGGVVTRIVRDDPDNSTGTNIQYPSTISTVDPEGIAYIEAAGNGHVDTEPDLYSYNFLGYAGKFVITRDRRIVSMPRSDLNFTWTEYEGNVSFIITTPAGIRCTFETPETTIMQSSSDASFLPAVTAWYLTKIEHPQGDEINLFYSEHTYTYHVGISQSIAKSTQRNSCDDGVDIRFCETQIESLSINQITLIGKRLAKIESPNFGSIEFSSSRDRSDLDDYKLNGFYIKDYNGKVIKQISLSYIFSNNSGPVGPVDNEFLKHRMFLSTVVEKDANSNAIKRFVFEYNEINSLPARLSYAQDHWGYFNGAFSNGNLYPTNLEELDWTGQPAFAIWGGNREPSFEHASKGILKSITYPTGGTTTFEYQSNTYYNTTSGNIVTGGVRIGETLDYDPVTEKTDKTQYVYAKHDQPGISSGSTTGKPDYVTRYAIRSPCGPVLQCGVRECPYVALHSSSTNSLFNSLNATYYSYVCVVKGEASASAGLVEHQFSIHHDNNGVQMWGTDAIKDAPLSNTGWDNNKETDTRLYAKKNNQWILLKHIHNNYKKDSRYHEEVPGLVVRKKYDPACKEEAVYHCDESNISKEYKYYTCIAQHKHHWVTLFGTHCNAPGFDMKNVTFKRHPCYDKEVNTTATLFYALYYLDAFEYRNISDWVYLDKTTETTYDENGENPVVVETQYVYEDEDHMQLSKTTSSGPSGEIIEVRTKYALDYSPGSAMISYMINQYMIGLPIKQETLLDGNQTRGHINIYNSRGQAEKVYIYESAELKPPVAHNDAVIVTPADYQLKVNIETDPITSNVIGVQKTDDFNTVYVWGYNDLYPIAEVKNAINASSTIQAPKSFRVSTFISAGIGETKLLQSFEAATTQTITPSISVIPEGFNEPPTPLVYIVLRKLDGTHINTQTANWGTHTSTPITISPGVYQWSYYTGDIIFDQSFTGMQLQISGNALGLVPVTRIFHTSFEEEGVENAAAKTGHKVWNGPFTINYMDDGTEYDLSYWKKTGTNQWELIEQVIPANTGTSSITIGSAGLVIDEVRMHPKGSMMTTYTYDPLVGVTSSNDPNNVITYYEYDNFQRLKVIKDQEGNVLKKYRYHYASGAQQPD